MNPFFWTCDHRTTVRIADHESFLRQYPDAEAEVYQDGRPALVTWRCGREAGHEGVCSPLEAKREEAPHVVSRAASCTRKVGWQR